MSSPDFLSTPDGRRIAYHGTAAQGEGSTRPGVMFLGGYASDMTGTKASFLQDWAERTGRAFLRFDYTGHGASSGTFREGSIGAWTRDALDALDALTEGPTILVGSSMGGWIATLAARERPDRVAGLVGVAAAPDFTEDLMWANMAEADRLRLAEAGFVETPNPYGPEPGIITRVLIEDGRTRLVLRTPLPLPFPVRLLHGTRDEDVPAALALRFLDHMDSPDARLTLVRGSDHRFSGPRELELIARSVEEIG